MKSRKKKSRISKNIKKIKRNPFRFFKKSKKQNLKILLVILGMALAILLLKNVLLSSFLQKKQKVEDTTIAFDQFSENPEITKEYLTVNEYSRPQIALKKVNGIVVHYVGNAGSTAEENRNYFDNLKITHSTKASSHFIVGLDGEILQLIPLEEISYCSNDRNSDTISIECCHPDENGKFNDATYQSLVHLVAWLCYKYDLKTTDVIRHYDVTGKMCPIYYVKHPKAWKSFLQDVSKYK